MLKKYFDFTFQKTDLIAFFAILFCYLIIKLSGITEIYENSLLENLQLIPLLSCVVLCFRAKNNKIFFRFIALVLFLAFLRELSYGRAIFCALPDNPHEFYKWSHYKYGWIAHVLIGLYIALGTIWALFNKIHKEVIEIVKKVKFPVWTFLFCFGLIIVQLTAEKTIHNSCIEETAELAIYCLALSLVIVYCKKTK